MPPARSAPRPRPVHPAPVEGVRRSWRGALNRIVMRRIYNKEGDITLSNISLATSTSQNADTATLNALPRDRAMFDGTHGPAGVPLSGTTDAGDGAAIEARAVSVDDGGATTTAWRQIATASGGSWSGMLDTPMSGSWYRADVRVRGSTAAPAQSAERFGVGHVIALWGQSELARFTLSSFNGVGAAPPVSDEGNLQVYWSENNDGSADWGAPALLRGGQVTTADPQSKHAAALSNALNAAYPDRKFAIAVHARGGTSRAQSAGASETRNWNGEVNIRDLAFPIAAMRPGVTFESWFFNDIINANTGLEFVADKLFPYATGLDTDGTADTDYPNHIPDLYGTTTHGVALHRYDGANGIENKLFAARRALRDLFASNPNVPAHLVQGLDMLAYANAPGDAAHPDTGSGYIDGMVRLFRGLIAGALRAAGEGTWVQPQFDNAQFAGDASYVEVWSSAGDITTHRGLRGETVPAGYPQVWGFRHNGVRVSRADIVGGRVRVYPEGAASFADGDTISFAADGAGADGFNGVSTNLANAVWKDHPVVDLGADTPPLLEAVPVAAATDPAVLDVIPAPTIPPDGNTNPNLGATSGGASTDNFADGVGAPSGNEGWTSGGGSWTYNGDGTIQVDATGDTTTGIITPKGHMTGREVELSFVVTSPDNATGDLYIKASMQGSGGGNSVYSTSAFTPALDARNKITLGTIPATNARFELEIRRESPAAGTYVFSELAIREVQP